MKTGTTEDNGVQGPPWRDFESRRRRAFTTALVFLPAVGIYAALQFYSYGHWAAPEMLDPRTARVSVLVTVFALAVVASYAALNFFLKGSARAQGRVYYGSTLVTLLLQLSVWVTHIHFNGSQNTVGYFQIPIIVIVASWLLSWREAVALFLLGNAGLGAVIGLEAAGILPYAPLLPDFQRSAQLFLSWQIIAGNLVTYLMMAIFFLTTSAFFQAMVLKRNRQLCSANTLLEAAMQEQRQSETALRESERHLRTILEHARDVIYTVSLDARITSLSPSFARATGWRVDEWIGRSLGELVHPEDMPRAMEMGERCLMGADAPIHEIRIRSQSSVYIPCEFSITRRIENDQITGIVGIGRDIRERKEMEEKLRKAQRLEALGILAGGVAHDLNNMLTPILVNVSAAKAYGHLAEEIADILTDAEKAGFRAKGLIKQLLTFSKGGAPSTRTVPISGLLQDTASLALIGSSARLECRLPQGLWPAIIDEGQIGQVVQNLVINADQAMPGGGKITIRAENLKAGPGNGAGLPYGNYLKVSITDQGVGIPEDRLARIFDPFYTTRQNGTGLGLAISQTIIERHQGTILVESEPGSGTTFHIYLPADADALRPEQQEARTSASP